MRNLFNIFNSSEILVSGEIFLSLLPFKATLTQFGISHGMPREEVRVVKGGNVRAWGKIYADNHNR